MSYTAWTYLVSLFSSVGDIFILDGTRLVDIEGLAILAVIPLFVVLSCMIFRLLRVRP